MPAAVRAELDRLIKETERVTGEGKVDEAKALIARIRALENSELKVSDGLVSVCEVCAAMLGQGGKAHVNGKQHKGFELVRAKLVELEEDKGEEGDSDVSQITAS
jgi:UDP-N-acetylglucosamine enolpyruvyl transferase